jgi:hypothetical protein
MAAKDEKLQLTVGRGQGEDVFPPTQRYYRRVLLYLFLLNCYMFRSYDHLQAEIALLTMDP